MRFLGALAATALSAVLFVLAFPPAGLKPLAWLCLVPFLLALRRVGLGGALVLAFLWGQSASLVVANALPLAATDYFLLPEFVAWALCGGVFAFTASVYYMAFAAVYRALGARYARALPLLTAAAWVAVELGRGRLFTGATFLVGNPWALLGYSQVGWDPMVQVASLTGVYGITFVLVAVNAALAELWLALRTGARSRRHATLDLGLAVLPALAALAYGTAELRAADRAEPASPAVRVAIIQGNVDVGSRWSPEFYGRNLNTYLELTLRAIDAIKPEIVFWPEAAFTFHLEDEPLFRRSIARVLAEGGTQLVAGGPYDTHSEPPVYHNSVFLLSEAGSTLGRYDKQYLVPFVEFTPLSRFDWVRRVGKVLVFTHGKPTPPLETRAGPAGILVCNEAMLPEAAADRVRAGATYLVSPSNDSWISKPEFARMMFDLVSLRAVEQRRYFVRASTSGPSAVVDPWGRVRVQAELGTPSVILGGIRPRTDLTPYARVGDLFALVCAATALVAFVATWRRRQGDSVRPIAREVDSLESHGEHTQDRA